MPKKIDTFKDMADSAALNKARAVDKMNRAYSEQKFTLTLSINSSLRKSIGCFQLSQSLLYINMNQRRIQNINVKLFFKYCIYIRSLIII